MSGVFVLQCKSGAVHVENGLTPSADNFRCAAEAAEFMDEQRDEPSWKCGPHSVMEASADSANQEGQQQ